MDVFGVLADPTRREVIRCLAEGPATATELAARFPVTRQAVAKHLGLLDDVGLVVATRDGRETRYQLRPEPFRDAMSWMATVGARWDDRLASLQRMLAKKS
jgi:DNA-binding transcriptional ArsR family regulator